MYLIMQCRRDPTIDIHKLSLCQFLYYQQKLSLSLDYNSSFLRCVCITEDSHCLRVCFWQSCLHHGAYAVSTILFLSYHLFIAIPAMSSRYTQITCPTVRKQSREGIREMHHNAQNLSRPSLLEYITCHIV